MEIFSHKRRSAAEIQIHAELNTNEDINYFVP